MCQLLMVNVSPSYARDDDGGDDGGGGDDSGDIDGISVDCNGDIDGGVCEEGKFEECRRRRRHHCGRCGCSAGVTTAVTEGASCTVFTGNSRRSKELAAWRRRRQ